MFGPSSSGAPSKSAANANAGSPTSNQPGAPLSTPGSMDSNGFARPPPDFDPEQASAALAASHGQGFLDPADAIEESVEDEIKRQISEVEKAKNGPVTERERERIATKIRALREGGWLEGLKLQLAGKDAVPIEYFNRLVSEHENTIVKVARINARADRTIAEKNAQIEALTTQNGTDSEFGDNSTLLNSEILHELNIKLEDQLRDCKEHGTKLKNEIQKLVAELAMEKSKPQGDANVQDAVAKCNDRVNELQSQLDSANRDLQTARATASRYYNEIQTHRQQKGDSIQRERGLKDEIIQLRADQKKGNDAFEKNKQEQLACNAMVKSLQRENQKLKDAAASSGEPNDPEGLRQQIAGLRQQIADLQFEVAARDETIKELQRDLTQARNASAPAQKGAAPQGTTRPESETELRAQIVKLRESRDIYRGRWARLLATTTNTTPNATPNADPNANSNAGVGDDARVDIENMNEEIRALYQGIERLGRVLGLENDVPNTPQGLERIITNVTGAVTDPKETPQLTILNLRNENILAQVQIETLARQLDAAQLKQTDDEIRVQLGVVQQDEVERLVSLRTQTYREHRRAIITHIFNAEMEFLDLAERSGDRIAIEALVDRFLQPTALPMIQLTQNTRQ